MNCFNHPDVPAVGICPSCGKAFCHACLDDKTSLCKDCAKAVQKSKMYTSMSYLILLLIIGLIGYHWDFIGMSHNEHENFMSAYMLMSATTALYLTSGKISLPFGIIMSIGTYGFLMLIKFVVLFIISAFILPFIILWQVFIIAKSRKIISRY